VYGTWTPPSVGSGGGVGSGVGARVAFGMGRGVGWGVGSGVTRGSGNAGSVATVVTCRRRSVSEFGPPTSAGEGVVIGNSVAGAWATCRRTRFPIPFPTKMALSNASAPRINSVERPVRGPTQRASSARPAY